MRVKYEQSTFNMHPSVAGGTSANWADFLCNILGWLKRIGAPINVDTVAISKFSDSTTAKGIASVTVRFDGEDTDPDSWWLGSLYLRVYETTYDNTVYLETRAWMYDPHEELYIYTNNVPLGAANSTDIYWVTAQGLKSGNSFYFGFGKWGGFINCAITPVRRLSDPTAEVGYGLVAGSYMSVDGTYYMSKTVPYVDGFNYGVFHTSLGWPYMPDIFVYPEVETGKIPLMPLFAGVEDLYYENVYITPMRSNGQEVKAFETDKGTFLISNTYMSDSDDNLINWTEHGCCQLAFDITEAMNSAT